MSEAPRSYNVITPVRNDEQNLRAVAAALMDQTVRPTRWIIADNGSTDSTRAEAQKIASSIDWVTAVEVPTDAHTTRGAAIVRAFHAGLAEVCTEADVIVKLDADITFGVDHYERLIGAFAADSSLGIVSGVCFEQATDGTWRQRHGSGFGVWGANRAYRRACLAAILPLEERMGWDTIDLVKASLRGWTTQVLEDVPFRHHRPEGSRESRRTRAWALQGQAAYFMGYRPSYLLLRTIYRTVQEPSAAALLWGYLSAVMRREQRCADSYVRGYLRSTQRWRYLLDRARKARRPRTVLGSSTK